MWIIIYLNTDAFAVRRDDYLQVVKEAQGDWIKVTEWVEIHGIDLELIKRLKA